MKIEGSIALVTGANRGLGAAFARGLLAAGASKVYAAARDPASVSLPGAVPVRLDVTQPEQIAALARELGEVTLLVNNAGIAEFGSLLDPNALDALHRQFETNAVGPLRLVQAFAPILAGNGGGAVINVLSVLSWLTMPGSGGYSASKAAGWALGNALRQELKAQDTELLAVHSAVIDTDMGRGAPGEKIAPEDLVQQAIAALQAGQPELLADPTTHHVHAGLVAQPRVYIGASS
ncbi:MULTISPECIES: SDR family oxidoreductase [unclassified Lysobacter]|uniref:SDR family oxidoreductase n=1 Tax=unclassified Lysobacter TaxID=2635362 RepID=UPI0006F6FBC4|nr:MULTISPECIES: SDR family oxidoreductase [unclassified Lysobacter]KRC31513.1 short-chain dehydrogenase [Lysobacter sp. Root76]KRD65420.1 short-chain dehydrogenase [Lysobacter sp. Root96]